MATLQDLIRSTRDFKPALFDNAQGVYVDQLNISRSKGTNTILFTATTRDSDKNKGRTAQMQFVVPSDVDLEDYKPSISQDRVLVRSSSPWYKFAFGYNNKDIGAHFGKVSQFTVKGTGRPVNPRNKPGLDKHLIAMMNTLKDEGLIRG